MKKTQHSPAPWKLTLSRSAKPRLIINAADGSTVASTQELNQDPRAKDDNAVILANADLMKAAPLLLAALKGMVARIEFYSASPSDQRPSIEQWEYTEGSSEMEAARAAILAAMPEQ